MTSPSRSGPAESYRDHVNTMHVITRRPNDTLVPDWSAQTSPQRWLAEWQAHRASFSVVIITTVSREFHYSPTSQRIRSFTRCVCVNFVNSLKKRECVNIALRDFQVLTVSANMEHELPDVLSPPCTPPLSTQNVSLFPKNCILK